MLRKGRSVRVESTTVWVLRAATVGLESVRIAANRSTDSMWR
jgi:hypothetical protein